MKTYAIINLSDTDKVIWSQVDQIDAQRVRRNVANTRCMISYVVEPSFITDETLTPISTLNKEQAITTMNSSDWYIDPDVD